MTALPNLTTWHPVPVGATIPANTPYASAYDGGATLKLEGYFKDIIVDIDSSYYAYYTERPVPLPLPTEEGATIVASNDERPPHSLLTRLGGRWVNRYGVEWYADRIRAWAPVTIGETVVVQP